MKGVKINYSQQELDFVKANCTLPIVELYRAFVGKFNRHDVTVKNLNALRKRNEWKTGRTGCFTKDSVPFNKGCKGWYAKGTEATRFKKGTKPPNHKPVGTIRQVDGYYEIKVAEGMRQWKLLHRVVWERLNGPIPKGFIVSFLDKNPENINITNMSLFTKVQNMKRNSLHAYPKEIAHLIQLQGAINRQLNKRIKNE
ncbi:MAG: HNH endonuclease signature motif containing protein [Pseudomonadota bacterium]